MAKKILKTNTAQLLDNVARAAFGEARSFVTVADAIKAAGGDSEDVRGALMVGYIAARLHPGADTLTVEMSAEAKRVWALPNANGKAPARRTAAQETIIAAARKAVSRHFAKAGDKVAHGGAGNTNASKPRQPVEKAAKPVPAPIVTPRFTSGESVRQALLHSLSTALAVANKNAGVKGYRTVWAEAILKAKTELENSPVV